MMQDQAKVRRAGRAALAFLLVLAIFGGLMPASAFAASATPSVESAASQWGCTTMHTVQRGDTLARIAWRYGTTVQAIASANGIWNPNHIFVGQVLVIPCQCPPTQPPTGGNCAFVHIVRHGEGLFQIAAAYGVNAAAIAQANGIQNWNHIYAGQRLCIPGGWAPQPPQPPQPWPPQPPQPPQPPPQPAGAWQGAYFTNRDLAGAPLYVTQDYAVNFDWGLGAPVGLPADFFSVEWNRTEFLQAGTYRFQATMDDGIRVWVDGQMVLDAWRVGPAISVFTDVWLGTGNHSIRVQYFEETGFASVSFKMQRL